MSAAFQETSLAEVTGQGLASAETVGSWDEAVTQVDDGDADAAFLFPAGLSDTLRSASPGTIAVVTSDQETYETLLAGALANRFADGVDLVRVMGATSAVSEPSTRAGAGPVRSVDDPVELRQLGLETYYVAGIAAFFVFFTVQFGLITFQSERRDGTLTRMLAAPIRPAAILAGKGLVSFILAVVSVCTRAALIRPGGDDGRTRAGTSSACESASASALRRRPSSSTNLDMGHRSTATRSWTGSWASSRPAKISSNGWREEVQ